MARVFKHLTMSDRLKIDVMRRHDHKMQEIADEIGVHVSTISRELKRATYIHRNPDWTEEERYCPEAAEEKYRNHLKEKGRDLKVGNRLDYLLFLEEQIRQKKSPYAALETAKKEGNFDIEISLSTFYNYIRKRVFPNIKLESCPMPHKKSRKKKVRTIKKAPKGTSIEKRPEEINQCEEEGHWEMDTVEGGKGSFESFLVITERRTMLEIIEPLRAHTAQEVVGALDRIERRMGSKNFRETFKSITVDNGCEFSDWEGMERSKRNQKKRTKIYVCHPYCSWERGRNESQNKFIRRFFPKGVNFDGTPRTKVKEIEKFMNTYPRAAFGGKSSEEMVKFLNY